LNFITNGNSTINNTISVIGWWVNCNFILGKNHNKKIASESKFFYY
jgi:hypothetical protein